MVKKIALYIASTLILSSCSILKSNNMTGDISLGFNLPQKTFSIKTIPESTEKIKIKVSGEGLNNPIEKELNKNSDKKLTIKSIPIGNKMIEAQAFDDKNKLVAQASTSINIEAGKSSTAILELKELIKNIKLVFSNYPDLGSQGIIELKSKNKTFYKEFSGNSAEIQNVPTEDYNLRTTIFSDNSMPLSFINSNVNVNENNTYDLALSKIIIPNISDIGSDFNPTQLFDLLNKIIIKTPDNKTPEIRSISLKINGVEVPQQSLPITVSKEICLNYGDNYQIDVDAVDIGGDKVSIFWGRTIRLKDNSLQFELFPDNNLSLSKTVDFDEGNSSIGFVVTDKKAYAGPFSLYFKKCK